MITFKNRYAEFDNLDDSYNENVFRNCYHREYQKFFNFNKNNRNGNNRYNLIKSFNFNDIRNGNDNYNNNRRQNSFTPFPKLPIINNNNMNYNNNISNNSQYQQQNINPSRSSPNMPSIVAYNRNYVATPSPIYNNNNNIFNNNNDSGFISNNYDTNNISNDSIQFFNETGNNNYNNNLNVSSDSQYNQEQNIINTTNQIAIRKTLDNELEELEKERKLLLEQEKLNQIDFELRYLRQKRNAELQRRLAEQQNLQYINRIRENEINYNNYNDNNKQFDNNITKVNYNYRINNYRNNDIDRNFYFDKNKSFNQNVLEETIKSNLMKDKLQMNELIDEINKMKLSQQEANIQFQKKMDDLVKQNESIKKVNEKMIKKIKDMKYVLSEKKQNNKNDYLIEQRKNIINENNLFDNNNFKNINNSKSYNFNRNEFDDLNIHRNIGENNYDFYLGKKDKDIEEFNTLNKNLINNNNNVVVTPLLYDDNKYIKRIKSYSPFENNQDNYNNYKNNTIDNSYSGTRKEDLYSLIRKNNNRLERIKELEEKN